MFKTDDKRFVLKTMSGTAFFQTPWLMCMVDSCKVSHFSGKLRVWLLCPCNYFLLAGEFKQLGRMMMVPSSRRHSSAEVNGHNDSTRGDQDDDLGRTALLGEHGTPGDGRVAFWQYMIDNPSSFIVKIFGVYKMTLSRFGSLNEGVKQYFIVMQNVFYDSDTSARMASIQETYDLKGSTVARSASPLKDGTAAICRFCRLEYTVGEKKNVPTPQPGDFVQLLRDRAQGDDPASISDEYDVCTGILQRQLPGGRWRVSPSIL